MQASRIVAKPLAMLFSAQAFLATGVEVRFDRGAEMVYVHVGDIGARIASDERLRANLGLVVAPGGAVLIDSSATATMGRLESRTTAS